MEMPFKNSGIISVLIHNESSGIKLNSKQWVSIIFHFTNTIRMRYIWILTLQLFWHYICAKIILIKIVNFFNRHQKTDALFIMLCWVFCIVLLCYRDFFTALWHYMKSISYRNCFTILFSLFLDSFLAVRVGISGLFGFMVASLLKYLWMLLFPTLCIYLYIFIAELWKQPICSCFERTKTLTTLCS